MSDMLSVAVAIPTYKAKAHILGVIEDMPDCVKAIYVIDDACPQGSGKVVEDTCKDPRVKVIYLDKNQGVGGATLTGFSRSFADGHDIVVKIDSDGQISPHYIDDLIAPIERGDVGYAKGSRFLSRKTIGDMPKLRLVLNALLSFTTKFASGYYSITDPTNGLVAINRKAYDRIDVDRVAKRYFFESDLLCHLNMARVKVMDMPMRAIYADEESNLRIQDQALSFAFGNIRNFFKRVTFRHFISNFHLPAIYFLFGFPLFLIGAINGLWRLVSNHGNANPASAGEVILPVLFVIVGLNMIMQFFLLDVGDEP